MYFHPSVISGSEPRTFVVQVGAGILVTYFADYGQGGLAAPYAPFGPTGTTP